jgi:hypothetical protein
MKNRRAPRVYPPKPHIVEHAHVSSMEEYERLYRPSLTDPGVVETLIAAHSEMVSRQ